MDERRRFIRHPLRLEAAYSLSLAALDEERVRQSETVNVSRGGCTLLMHTTERPGARLVVHLGLPSGQEVAIQGMVAWVREPLGGSPGTMGVYFEETQPIAAELIALLDQVEDQGKRNG